MKKTALWLLLMLASAMASAECQDRGWSPSDAGAKILENIKHKCPTPQRLFDEYAATNKDCTQSERAFAEIRFAGTIAPASKRIAALLERKCAIPTALVRDYLDEEEFIQDYGKRRTVASENLRVKKAQECGGSFPLRLKVGIDEKYILSDCLGGVTTKIGHEPGRVTVYHVVSPNNGFIVLVKDSKLIELYKSKRDWENYKKSKK